MNWTQRMQDVREAKADLIEAGKMPTLQAIADKLGIGRERVRQIQAQIQRFEAAPATQLDSHVRCWKSWVFANANLVLPLIEKAARSTPRALRMRKEEHLTRARLNRLLLKWRGFVAKLPERGPLNILPQHKWQGPRIPYTQTLQYRRFRHAQRESAAEWFMTYGLTKAQALQKYDDNDRGIATWP